MPPETSSSSLSSSPPPPPPPSSEAAASDGRPRPTTTGRKRGLPLYHPDDQYHLSALACLVRRQLEIFVGPPPQSSSSSSSPLPPSPSSSGAERVTSSAAQSSRRTNCDEGDGGDGSASSNQTASSASSAASATASDLYAAGRVGLRCVHCAPPDGIEDADVPCGLKRGRRRKNAAGVGVDGGSAGAGTGTGEEGNKKGRGLRRARGAASYPTSTRLVYQAVRNFQRHHLLACEDVPPEVKAEYASMRASPWQRRSGNETARYWEIGCARVGLADAGGALRLRREAWEGTWTEEMGRAAAGRVAEATADDGRGGGGASESGSGTAPKKQASSRATAKKAVARGDAKRRGVGAKAKGRRKNEEKRPPCAVASSTTPLIPTSSSSPIGGQTFDQSSIIGQSDNGIGGGEGIAVGTQSDDDDSDGENNSTTNCGGSGLLPFRPELSVDHRKSFPPMNDAAAHLKKRASPEVLENIFDLGIDDGSGVESSPVGTMAAVAPTSAPPAESSPRPPPLPPPPPAAPNGRTLLESVTLARCAVRAVGNMRELPPSLPHSSSYPAAAPRAALPGNGGRGDGDEGPQDLSYLGLELYELLSGRRPYDDEAAGSDEEDGGSLPRGTAIDGAPGDNLSLREEEQRRKKREKRPERRKKYVPLRELGLPPCLCFLVSSLLDGTGDYGSVDDVEEDLRLMEEQPDKYLVFGGGGGGSAAAPAAAAPRAELRVTGRGPLPPAALGRAEETAKLLEVFDRTVDAKVRTNNVVLVSGYAGTGKSSLVHSVRGRFVERGAHFLSGKFDAMQQMRPLSVVVSALDEYCDLLARDEGRIGGVREAVTAAVGGEGQVLTNLIPNLRKVLVDVPGADGSSTHVSGREALQRLLFLFRVLLRATCSRDHPVVLFLDDLQWADEVSLELMHALVIDSRIRGLLFIGCYRNNEVCSTHPLMKQLSNIQKSEDVEVVPIRVGNLNKNVVNSLVADVLQMLPRMTRPLADEVLHKTGGNALFVVQFLVSLHDEGLLRFCLSTRQWEWDLDKIRTKNIADNVVELMTAKILKLAPEVRDALMLAASLGAHCDEEILRIINRAPEQRANILAALDVAEAEGLMVKSKSAYRFSHDQIQRAAYLLVPGPEREAYHLAIGRRLWRNATPEELETYLFAVIDQMHRGAHLISNHNEKVNFAQLCLLAGQKAAAKCAFLPALFYFKHGIGLTVSDDWESHRELCLDLYDSCAEMESILGRFEDVKGRVDEVLQRGRTLQEKLRAYSTLIKSIAFQGKKNDAASTAIAVLGCLGESFPSTPNESTVQEELVKTQAMLGAKKQDDILNMKLMQDADKREVMKLLAIAFQCDYAGNRTYVPLLLCRMVQLSLTFGLSRESAMAFAFYGFLISGFLNDRDIGSRFGKLALAMLDKFHKGECLVWVYGAVYGFISNWTDPIQASLPCLKHAVDVGLLTGDTEAAMLSAHLYVGTALHSGYQLEKLMDETNVYAKQMLEYNQNLTHTLNAPLRQTILNLLGRSANPVKLVGDEMNEDFLLQSAEENSHEVLRSMISLFRMWLAYLFGEYHLAAETAEKNQDFGEKTALSRFDPVCCHTFYNGLTALILARKEGQSKWTSTIESTTRRMEVLSSSCQWNCQHKLELMKAEYAYLEGNHSESANLYESAAKLAEKHHFIHDQALSLERAGMFYLENGNDTAASIMFEKSFSCYTKWGAYSKAAHLKRLYL